MKNAIFYTSLVSQLLLGGAVIAAPVAGGGGGARVAPVIAAPGAPIVQPATPAPQKAGNRDLLPQNGVQPQINRSESSATNSVAANTNGMSGTNGLAGNGNATGVAVNVNPMTPRPTAIVGNKTSINGNLVQGDQTVTASDRVLLTSLGQQVRATLGVTPNVNLPVHFLINNGAVTVVGTVQNDAQSQSVLSQVQQTPGVSHVISDLRVAPLATAQANSANSSFFAGQTDHAFSPRDEILLTTVQQQAAMQLGINNASQMPVHFSIQGGIVGITGQVASLQEKQALISAITRTPGITRVVDNVGVRPGAAGFNNGLPATSRSSGSNTIFLNNTNASGF
jgi:osmotically-inducible protein OsmY